MKVAWIALLLLGAVAQSQTPPGSIEGTVMHGSTGEVFPGVPIRLNTQTTTTDARGHFLFDGIAPGQYRLMAGPNYIGTTQTINVTSGQHIQGAVFPMSVGGSVSGRIFDPNGRARAGVTVNLAEWTYADGQEILNTTRTMMTDGLGTYHSTGLFPGDYAVIAERTYFPGTVDRNEAKPVVVAAETEASGIDFKIQPQPSPRISGRIIVPDPGVSANAGSLVLIPRGAGTPSYAALDRFNNVASAEDRNAGLFEMWSVPSGSYDLFVQLPGSRGETYSAWAEVRVGSDDVRNVMLATSRGGNLSGRITTASSSPIPMQSMQITLRARDVAASIPFAVAKISSNATMFTASNLVPGRYRVVVSGLPADACVSDILQDGRSVFADGMVSVSGEASPAVEIVVGSSGATLEGMVVTVAGKENPRTVVSLVPAARENLGLYKRVTSDANGHFSFRGVAPGDYLLFAWGRIGTDLSELNSQFLKPYESQGQQVSVQVGSHVKDISVKLILR
jgi:protocatechuate 3,4-dioxygenase beta subunit